MDSNEQTSLLKEISALRKDVRSMRRWTVFASVCLAIFVIPQILDYIDRSGTRGVMILQIAGLIAFFYVVAAVISHFSPKSS